MKRKIGGILMVTILLMGIAIWRDMEDTGQNAVPRTGEDQEKTIYAEVEQRLIEVPISMEAREMTKNQANNYLDNLEENLADMILGENQTLSSVQTGLKLPSLLENGQVKINWSCDPIDLLDPKGKIVKEEIPEGGIPGVLTASVVCQQQQRILQIPITVRPVQEGKWEKYERSLRKEIKLREEQSRTGEEVELPEEFQGKKIVWKERKGRSGVGILLAGGLAILLCLFGQWQDRRKKEEARSRQLEAEYPEMVSKLSILLDAGIPLREAWDILASDMPGIAGVQMRRTRNEIASGVAEEKAYQAFGTELKNREYKNMISLLLQHRRRGTRDLKELLNQEVRQAQVKQKSMVMKKSGEAGTRLLFPLLLLLGVVMAILMIPALWTFQMG